MGGFNLSINSGPQDSLLYDPSRSYFTNVGYVRTSNFATELRDVHPQNTADLGSTVQFVIPKAADLLGPVDLMVEMNPPKLNGNLADTYSAWVESLGLAMIDTVTFSIGSHDIERITGDQLYIMNELMKGDEARLGKIVGKTGNSAVKLSLDGGPIDTAGSPSGTGVIGSGQGTYTVACNALYDESSNRIIAHGADSQADMDKKFPGKKLIVPLGLFFTKHPSQYFPLCAIAGANDVRISIKFRTAAELIQLGSTKYPHTVDSNGLASLDGDSVTGMTTGLVGKVGTWDKTYIKSSECKLRCHYVHVTGPEATALMNKEHVRLLRLWQQAPFTKQLTPKTTPTVDKIDLDLSFLHPVQELIIIIRKQSELSSDMGDTPKLDSANQGAVSKNRFAFHGGSSQPNIDHVTKKVRVGYSAVSVGGSGLDNHVDAVNLIGVQLPVPVANSYQTGVDGTTGSPSGNNGLDAKTHNSFVELDSIKLTLNGQDRHPSLAADGIDKNYLMNRLLPMLHSNTSDTFSGAVDSAVDSTNAWTLAHLGEMLDRKNIFVYPLSINPEGANPSGAVNFSKVSHAKLTLGVKAWLKSGGSQQTGAEYAGAQETYNIDVYGVNFNWLQIKDGRALVSFA